MILHDGKYVVVVEADDPSDLSASVVVVITARNVNDNPVLSGRPELTIAEDERRAFAGSEANPASNLYSLMDEDRHSGNASWTLAGEDESHFQLTGTAQRTLIFRAGSEPDFEEPADADGDNVYKVTIVVTDNSRRPRHLRRVHSCHQRE